MNRNPFRSEQDAFRLFVLVGGAVVFVALVAVVVSSKVAAYIGLALLLFGLFHMARWIAEAISQPEEVGKGRDEAEEAPAGPDQG